MARVFITGSADGLGLMAAQLLVEQGHDVVVHGRTPDRADEAKRLSGARTAVFGDLASIAQTKALADQVNALGRMDAIIHNAGIGYREARRGNTEDALPPVFAVNTVSTYVLTCLIARPSRLVYMSSGMHFGVRLNLDDITWDRRGWNGSQAYAETKLHDAILAYAVARRWPDVLSNAVEPGWVATKMGGRGAPDDLDLAHRTQAWLAVSADPAAKVTSHFWRHQHHRAPNPAVEDPAQQDHLIEALARITGVPFPD
jgi:NAD(P)-dependent dehydrogenase (short-subunit alcohol dehydrogenase family)